jgi:hypothetical protein
MSDQVEEAGTSEAEAHAAQPVAEKGKPLHEHSPFVPLSNRVVYPVVAVAWLVPIVVLVYSLRSEGPALGGVADKVLFGSFVVFAVGLAELFLLLIALTVMGRINLARAFQDKRDLPDSKDDSEAARYVRAVVGRGSVSLSRLQAFLWTLVVLTTYFHRAVTDQSDQLPSIPPDLLLVMGISGAVYLTSKQIGKG